MTCTQEAACCDVNVDTPFPASPVYPCASSPCPPQLIGWLHVQVTQPFFCLWALIPACHTYSLLTFTLMSSPILSWLLIGFMSLGGPRPLLSPCCFFLPAACTHGSRQGLPPSLQLQGKVQLSEVSQDKPSLTADLSV